MSYSAAPPLYSAWDLFLTEPPRLSTGDPGLDSMLSPGVHTLTPQPTTKRCRNTRVYSSALSNTYRAKILQERQLLHLLDQSDPLPADASTASVPAHYRADLTPAELLTAEDVEQDIARLANTCALPGGAAPLQWPSVRGGLVPGAVTELTGSAGTGKSQLCMQTLLMAVGPTCAGGRAGKVGVVSCRDFPQPRRLLEIVQTHAMSDDEYRRVCEAYWRARGEDAEEDYAGEGRKRLRRVRACPFHCICGSDVQTDMSPSYPCGLSHPCMRLWLHMYGAALLDDIDAHTVPARTHTQPTYRRALASLLEAQHSNVHTNGVHGIGYTPDALGSAAELPYSFGQYVQVFRAQDAAEAEVAVELMGLWAAVDARQVALAAALRHGATKRTDVQGKNAPTTPASKPASARTLSASPLKSTLSSSELSALASTMWTSCPEAPFLDCVPQRHLSLVVIDDLASMVQHGDIDTNNATTSSRSGDSNSSNGNSSSNSRNNGRSNTRGGGARGKHGNGSSESNNREEQSNGGPSWRSNVAYDTLARVVQYVRALCGTYHAACVCVWTAADDAHRSDQYYQYTCPLKDGFDADNGTGTGTNVGTGSRACVDVLGARCTIPRAASVDGLVGAVCEHVYPPVWQCSGKWVRSAVGLPWHNLVNGSIVLTRDVRREGRDDGGGWGSAGVTYHAKSIATDAVVKDQHHGSIQSVMVGSTGAGSTVSSADSAIPRESEGFVSKNEESCTAMDDALSSNPLSVLEEVRLAPGINMNQYLTSQPFPKGPVRLAFTLRGGLPQARLAFIYEGGLRVYESSGIN